MDAIEKRARELLAAEWEKCGDVGRNVARGLCAGASLPMDVPAIRAIIAALTPPEGYVLVPKVLTEDMLNVIYTAESDMSDDALQELWTDIIADRPEVKP